MASMIPPPARPGQPTVQRRLGGDPTRSAISRRAQAQLGPQALMIPPPDDLPGQPPPYTPQPLKGQLPGALIMDGMLRPYMDLPYGDPYKFAVEPGMSPDAALEAYMAGGGASRDRFAQMGKTVQSINSMGKGAWNRASIRGGPKISPSATPSRIAIQRRRKMIPEEEI